MHQIGILGGTFNPIHMGHISMAEEMGHRLGLASVLLIPALTPPHKDAPDLAPADHRLQMCRLAITGHPLLCVSDIELARKGFSFTVDTLRALHEDNPAASLFLLMGADMFLTVQSWFCFEEITRLATLCAAPRGEGSASGLQHHASMLQATHNASCIVCDCTPPPVSSSQIREKIRNGEPIDGLLPDAVKMYIHTHSLYR